MKKKHQLRQQWASDWTMQGNAMRSLRFGLVWWSQVAHSLLCIHSVQTQQLGCNETTVAVIDLTFISSLFNSMAFFLLLLLSISLVLFTSSFMRSLRVHFFFFMCLSLGVCCVCVWFQFFFVCIYLYITISFMATAFTRSSSFLLWLSSSPWWYQCSSNVHVRCSLFSHSVELTTFLWWFRCVFFYFRSFIYTTYCVLPIPTTTQM